MVTAITELKYAYSLKKSYDQPKQHMKKQRHYFANKSPSSQGCFSSSHVWMWELDCEEGWVPKNWCFWTVVLEKTLESPLDCKEIQPVHPKGDQSWVYWKDWCWSWNSNTLAKWCEELTHLKRPWCWERLRAREEGDNRRWNGWMAWPTWWTWVWVSSGSWWWTGRPGLLWTTGSQRVGHDWATELNWCISINNVVYHVYAWRLHKCHQNRDVPFLEPVFLTFLVLASCHLMCPYTAAWREWVDR